jgi:hypothetical protein
MADTKVVNVKVKYIRPEYNNLEEWMKDRNNVYIGRRGIVFINKERFPKENSIWHNPFKINKNNTREDVILKYKEYIIDKIEKEKLQDKLLELKGKNLGCWCKEGKDEGCHGDVLVELLNGYV